MRTIKKMTKEERVVRALEGCRDYARGNLTLQQIWYRVRGEQNREYFRCLKDATLRRELHGLSMDFFACYGYDNELLDARIRVIAAYLERLESSKSERRRPDFRQFHLEGLGRVANAHD